MASSPSHIVSPEATPSLMRTSGAVPATTSVNPAPGSQTPIAKGESAGTVSKNIILTEAGKAAWYDASGQVTDAYIVGIAGGSASGKTSVARQLIKQLPNVPWMTILSADSFYKPLTPEQSKLAFLNQYDFDHPQAFDYELLFQCINDLKKGRAVEIPNYSFVHHQRMEETTYLYGANVVLLEGLFVLQDPQIRDLLDLKIFVQADSDLMLARRILRDVKERGRDVEGILQQYLTFVKPSMDNFISSTMKFADIIVPGQKNDVAINVISQHIRSELSRRSNPTMRTRLSKTVPNTPHSEEPPVAQLQGLNISPWGIASKATGQPKAIPLERTTSEASFLGVEKTDDVRLPDTVHVLPQTNQLRGLLTILHDETTEGEEFIFHCNRVATLVVEAAMSLLPYRSKTVSVSTGAKYTGKEIDAENICSVSILRSGGVFETSLRRAIPDLALGSLLIQSADDGEPFLYSVRLPSFIRSNAQASKSFVFLADAQIGTGAAAFMAIRVLLDHAVKQEHIVFITLLASAKGGIHALAKAFPKVRIVVAGIAPGLRRTRVPYRPEQTQVQGASSHQNGHTHAKMTSLSLPPAELTLSNGDAVTEARQRTTAKSAATEDDEVTGADAPKTRVCYALQPGCGNIGNRYWRT